VARSIKMHPGSVKERIPETTLRKFVDDIASGSNLADPRSAIALLDTGAALAPALAGEVLALRAPILRALTEGCPKAGRLCAWCETSLVAETERHRPGCPWLSIVNASSWLGGIQMAIGTRTTDTDRLERLRELVRIVLATSAMGASPIHLEDEAVWSDAQRAAYDDLRREAGLVAIAPLEPRSFRPRFRVPVRRSPASARS
jgi:hypothetical protein